MATSKNKKVSNMLSCIASEIFEKINHELEAEIDEDDSISVIRIRTKKKEYILAPDLVSGGSGEDHIMILLVEQELPDVSKEIQKEVQIAKTEVDSTITVKDESV